MLYNKRDNIKSRWIHESSGLVALLIREVANYWNARNYQDHWWSGNEVQIFCHDKPNTAPDDPTSCQSYGGTSTYPSIVTLIPLVILNIGPYTLSTPSIYPAKL
jgi:hypothetical protein